MTRPSPPPDPHSMMCPELVELVTAYLDDALTADDRARFEAHLAVCDDCTVFVDQFRQTIAAVGALPGEPPRPETREELLGVFRGWFRGRAGR